MPPAGHEFEKRKDASLLQINVDTTTEYIGEHTW
jgi:hypothetical protein